VSDFDLWDENAVFWNDKGPTGVLAQCRIWWYIIEPHEIIAFDIEFNDYYTWTIGTSPGAYDVQSIATHELGHALGLLDLYGDPDSEKTMYGYGSTNDISARDLEPEDEAGIAYIYPILYRIYLPVVLKDYSS
jgi:hypothetical protein